MKRNGLSSNRRLKTDRGACAQDRSGFIPSAASTILWGARGGATRRCTHKNVKNKDRSGYVHENKQEDDN
jgi:hypothetical protein